MGNLVEIARFYEPEEAFCTSSYLQSFDIVVIIQNEYHLTIDPAMRIGLGGFRLLVSSEAATSATSHLADVLSPVQEETLMPQSHECDQVEQKSPSKQNWLWLVIAFFWFVPFVSKIQNKNSLFNPGRYRAFSHGVDFNILYILGIRFFK